MEDTLSGQSLDLDAWTLLTLPVPTEDNESDVNWQPRNDYVPRSLWGLSFKSPLRRVAISLYEHPAFEACVLLFVFANSVILALYDPSAGAGEGRNRIIVESEYFFFVVFNIEMVIKVIAMGLVTDGRPPFIFTDNGRQRIKPYLRSGWNVLDAIIIVTSVLSILPDISQNLNALRMVRVLRPLRTITAMKGMRLLAGTMIKSVPMIGNVLLMCLFLFTTFGIFGVQVYAGVLRYRCFEPSGQGSWTPVDVEQVCAQADLNWPGFLCPAPEQCRDYGVNPNAGITSFDNFLLSALTIFQVITLEGWTQVMYYCMDATTGWSIIYFLLLVFLGSFFLLNLALGVISEVYQETEQEMARLQAIEKEEADMQRQDEERDWEADPSDEAAEPRNEAEPEAEGTVKALCVSIISRSWFPKLILLFIIANVLALATEYYGMSQWYSDLIDYANMALTLIFLAEMIIKIIALTPRGYLNDSFNQFDAVVVCVSILELMFRLTDPEVSSSGGLSAFRAFRILRVLKLVNSWKSLKSFISVLLATIRDLGNLCMIVILIVYIFSLLGMQAFGGQLMVDGVVPRANFDSFLWSMVTVFQILTGEDWNQVMYDTVESTGTIWSSLYFIVLICIGDFMVMNLFVAILLSNFSDSHEPEPNKVSFTPRFLQLKSGSPLAKAKKAITWFKNRRDGSDATTQNDNHAADMRSPTSESISVLPWEPNAAFDCGHGNGYEGSGDSPAETSDEKVSSDTDNSCSDYEAQDEGSGKVSVRWGPLPRFKGAQPVGLESCCEVSVFWMKQSNPLRAACFSLADDKRFEWAMMILIIASSACIAIETPRMEEEKVWILFIVDTIFTVAFVIEMLIKIIALGFAMSKNSYLRDGWNILDGSVVLMSILSVMLSSLNVKWVKTLRAFRVLRPLRVINRIPELKVAVNAIFASLPELGNVVLVSLLFWLVFGILGMQLFLGKFFSCSQDRCCAPAATSEVKPTGLDPCSSQFWDKAAAMQWPVNSSSVCCLEGDTVCCEVKEVGQCIGSCQWRNAPMNFDNIIASMETLFQMATTEGWTTVMYQGVDAVGVGLQPRRNAHPEVVVYFIAFMIIGYFFIINLFVGIIVDKFSEEEKGEDAKQMQSKYQMRWVNANLLGTKQSHPRARHAAPRSAHRKALLKIVTSTAFDVAVMACIIINVVFMALEHYGQGQLWDNLQTYVNLAFTIIYMLEASLKIVALGINEYFASGWNCLDFVLVVLSIIGVFLQSDIGTNVMRVFRVARVFRLIRSLKGLRIIFTTLVVSLPTVINVFVVGFLILFMYAVLGVNMFGRVKFGEEITRNANFHNFGMALLLLLRVSTGEAWNVIMHDCMVQPPECDPSDEPYCALVDGDGDLLWRGDGLPAVAPGSPPEADCTCDGCSWRDGDEIGNCGTRLAPLYFISYFIVGAFVLLNLIIAIVLQNFSNSKKRSRDELSESDLKQLSKAWRECDPGGRGSIPVEDLGRLIARVPPPLGLSGEEITRVKMILHLRELDVDCSSGRIHWRGIIRVRWLMRPSPLLCAERGPPSHSDLLHPLPSPKMPAETRPPGRYCCGGCGCPPLRHFCCSNGCSRACAQAFFLRIARLKNIDIETLPHEIQEQLAQADPKESCVLRGLDKWIGNGGTFPHEVTSEDEHKIEVVQAYIRGFLARKRLRRQLYAQNRNMARRELADRISLQVLDILVEAEESHAAQTVFAPHLAGRPSRTSSCGGEMEHGSTPPERSSTAERAGKR